MESLKTILYFSIFRYPLKLEEIHSYTNYATIFETKNELEILQKRKVIQKEDEFYVYNNDSESIEKRIKGNTNAAKILNKAKQNSVFISKFPFVESVGISGSLSKGYYDNESDIDYFVICKPNKLWICRTLLMAYKKIFLLNSKKYFCLGYFIATNQLEIEEKNRFTATEIITLIPMQGKFVFQQFYQKNSWVSNYFSKFDANLSNTHDVRKPFISRSLETFFNTKLGDKTDNFLKLITVKKWKAKFNKLNETDFNIALKSTKNISKHHPLNFQKKVIVALNSKIDDVKNKFNIVIQKENV